MEEWKKIDKIGVLYKEIDLIIGVEPVLFVCKKYNTNDRYLVMTYDSYAGIYVIVPIKNSTLLSMLSNQITIEQAFRKSDVIFTTQAQGAILISEAHDPHSFPGDMLPKINEYYDLDYEYIKEYRTKL